MEQDTPRGMVTAALAEIREVMELEGAGVLDVSGAGRAASWLHVCGHGADGMTQTVTALLTDRQPGPAHAIGPGGQRLIACPWVLPPNRAVGLALWRGPRGRAWASNDYALAAMAAAMLRVMLEYGPDEGGIDRLTGLPNRPYFLEEVDRRIERLSQEGAPGTMMLMRMADLPRLAAIHGQPARDWMLVRLGALIRAMVRPTDLVGRVGEGLFAAWLDGADHMTAAERAEALCARRLTLPEAPGREVVAGSPLSIGIATRAPAGEEDARELILRARDAAALVGFERGGGWHVWRGLG
jgi:diguanylate cyclase (GGDEF)-like protein